MATSMDGCNLEFIAEDATRGATFDDIPIISVSDLLLLLMIQIHCNFYDVTFLIFR